MKNNMKNEIKIFCAKDWEDYELLDTGEGEKLEKFGPYIFVRPYENAVWPKALGAKELWNRADGKFWSSKVGAKAGWKINKKIEDKWEMEYKGIKFLASPTPFRHLGFFPEQAAHWDFIEEKIAKQLNSPLEEYSVSRRREVDVFFPLLPQGEGSGVRSIHPVSQASHPSRGECT